MCLRENLGEKIEGELLQKMPQMPFFFFNSENWGIYNNFCDLSASGVH